MAEGSATPGPDPVSTGSDSTGSDSASPAPGAGAAELSALQARIAVLEAELQQARTAGPPPAADGAAATYAEPVARPPRSARWRPWAVGLLLALAIPLAISTVVARWAHNEIGNTDRYIATISPLASDPVIQQEAVNKITDAIFTRFDVQAVTEEAIDALAGQGLPPRAVQTLDALTVPLVNGIQSFVRDQVTKIVTSEQFETAWIAANTVAHAQVVAVLTGEGTDVISVDGDTISLNLAPIVEEVKARLIEAGFSLASRIPAVNASFTLVESAELGQARSAFAALSASAVILPFLTLLVLGLAVFLARNRRKTLIIASFTLVGSMLLLGTALNLLRPLYLDQVPPEVLSTPAAGAIFDAALHFLRLALRLVAAVSLLIALVAWATGPSRIATGGRRSVAKGARAVGSAGSKAGSSTVGGVNSGAAGGFAQEHLVLLRVGVVGVAVLLYAVAQNPGTGYVVTLLVLAVLAWLAVEFLARTAPVPTAGAAAETAGTASADTAASAAGTAQLGGTASLDSRPTPGDTPPPQADLTGADVTAKTIELDAEVPTEPAGRGPTRG